MGLHAIHEHDMLYWYSNGCLHFRVELVVGMEIAHAVNAHSMNDKAGSWTPLEPAPPSVEYGFSADVTTELTIRAH